MGKPKTRWTVLVMIFAVEVAREYYVLRAMGFQPAKFAEWLKGGSNA